MNKVTDGEGRNGIKGQFREAVLLSDVPIVRGLRLTSSITASVWRIYANGCGCCLAMTTPSPLLRKMINLMYYLLYLYYNEMYSD